MPDSARPRIGDAASRPAALDADGMATHATAIPFYLATAIMRATCRRFLSTAVLLLPAVAYPAAPPEIPPASAAQSRRPAQDAIALGTLFYSPFERAAINAARRGEAMGSNTERVQIDGLVKRPRGKSTAWINGNTVSDEQPQYLDLPVTIRHDGVQLEKRRLRVGENLDLSSGEQSDLLPADAIRIRR